jgi:hypothetical protein
MYAQNGGAGNEVEGSRKDFSWSGDARDQGRAYRNRRMLFGYHTAKERQLFTSQGRKAKSPRRQQHGEIGREDSGSIAGVGALKGVWILKER